MALPQVLLDAMQSSSRRPIWVFEIIFNSGGHGTEGVNDIYIGSADVSEIDGFPYPERYLPVLDIDSISGLSQKLDLLNGVMSISNISFRALDKDNMLSKVIGAADQVDQGLRRQMVEAYEIEAGGTWATDKVKVRTVKMTNARQSSDGQWWNFTAHDVQSDMQGTVFEPMLTTLAAGMLAADTSFTVTDSGSFELVAQPVYGTVGFMKIEDEIIMWSAKSVSHVVTVAASGRGMFGTTAADHANGAEVSEVIVLRGNPLALALQVLTSTGDGTNGTYDICPAHWGIGLDAVKDVNVSEFEDVAAGVTGMTAGDATTGMQYQFIYNKSISGKMFIESRIFKQIGVFAFIHGDGSYGLKPYSDLANAAKENASRHLTVDNVVKWGDIDMDLKGIVNDILVKFDEYPPLSGKFIRNSRFFDLVSITKHGRQKQPLTLKAEGIIPTSIEVDQLYQRIHMIGAQLSTPPRKLPVTLMPGEGDIVVGEVVRLTLPVYDPFTGNDLDIAAQVDSVSIHPKTGEPNITVRAQHEKATFWQGGTGEVASLIISPASPQVPPSGTHQLVARAFDAGGNQLPLPTLVWVASGDVTIDANGLVTAGASAGSGTVYAVAGTIVSNTSNITVQALSGNPVASVAVSPSVAELQVGLTQQMSAEVLDAAGDATSYTAITWASDDTGVATVNPSTGVVTAVADGTCNITATETGSSIVSAPVVVSVVPAKVPTYQPPYLADSCYQIGTQITAHGPAGGPHVIPDAYNFAKGDYWYDGDVSLPYGSTCTIGESVRIFCLGDITIEGTIDGKGLGHPGGNGGGTGQTPSGVGHVGRGGNAYGYAGGKGGPVRFDSPPVVTIIGEGTPSWTSVSGLPDHSLCGSGGGGGAGYQGPYFADGGDSGAGLLLMARGIFITTGIVDLRGNNGQDGAGDSGPAGGGGGGSFEALAERDVNGLPVMSIDPARVLVDGGIGGYWPAAKLYAQSGGPGQYLTQVIG